MLMIRRRLGAARLHGGPALVVFGVVGALVLVVGGWLVFAGRSHASHRHRVAAPEMTDDGHPYDWHANPLDDSIPVHGVGEAGRYLRFSPFLPRQVAPTGIWVANPASTLPAGLQLAANFDDAQYGLFQVSEQPSALSEAALEQWATGCNTCTIQRIVVVGGRHVLLMATPERALGVSWLRGDEPGVLTMIQGPYGSFSEASALALAADVIGQEG